MSFVSSWSPPYFSPLLCFLHILPTSPHFTFCFFTLHTLPPPTFCLTYRLLLLFSPPLASFTLLFKLVSVILFKWPYHLNWLSSMLQFTAFTVIGFITFHFLFYPFFVLLAIFLKHFISVATIEWYMLKMKIIFTIFRTSLESVLFKRFLFILLLCFIIKYHILNA